MNFFTINTRIKVFLTHPKSIQSGCFFFATLLFLFLWFATGCFTSNRIFLNDTDWELQSLEGEDVLIGSSITFRLSRGNFNGSAGCNNYSGISEVQDERITLSQIFQESEVCEREDGTVKQALMDQENKYIDALLTVYTFEISGNKLELYNSQNNPILVFIAQTIAPTATTNKTSVQSTDEPPDTIQIPDSAVGIVEKLAPIDRFDILISQTTPPTYILSVKTILPNSCAEFNRYEVNQKDDLIQVKIVNNEPLGITCQQIAQSVDHYISLGNNLQPGRNYTLQINNLTHLLLTEGEPLTTPTPQVIPSPTIPLSLTVTKAVLDGETAACPIPSGWYQHLIVSTDTMYNIARRSGSSVDELTAVNCIENPRRIFVGEPIFVPNPVSVEDTRISD